ncbi:MAG: DUF2490 domain-containing protein [Acidobacteriota bacterium]
MKHLKSALILGLLTLAPLRAASESNGHAWFMYFGDHPIKKSRWGIHLEGQWRRAELGAVWQQLLLRPAVNFQLNKKVALTGGYGFIETYRYDQFPTAHPFPEHRFFEQATITQRFLKLDWQNRLRLEQRNLGVETKQPDGSFLRTSFRYENRFRYMLRTSIPLPFDKKKNYIGIYDEIMYNFGKNVAANVFDQNRAYIALGRDVGHQTKVEVGFMEQTIQQRSGLVYEHNHTIQVAIYSKIPFFGKD